MPRPKTFDTEKALLNAMHLFWQRGYAATSIDDLVQALGLSRSSIYDTFGDKRQLFLNALNRYREIIVKRFSNRLDKSDSVAALLNAVFDELIEAADSESGKMGCFMVNSVAELAPYDDDVTKIAYHYNTEMIDLITLAVQKGQQVHEFSAAHDPAPLALFLFNNMQGMRLLIKSRQEKDMLLGIKNVCLAALC